MFSSLHETSQTPEQPMARYKLGQVATAAALLVGAAGGIAANFAPAVAGLVEDIPSHVTTIGNKPVSSDQDITRGIITVRVNTDKSADTTQQHAPAEQQSGELPHVEQERKDGPMEGRDESRDFANLRHATDGAQQPPEQPVVPVGFTDY